MSLSGYLRSGLSFARRNAGKIAMVTVAAGTAVAVTTYFKRQANAVSAAIHSERTQGARKLRAVFVANSQSICTAFRNLLPNLRMLVSECTPVDTSRALGRLRERPADLAEKQALWQQVKIASITHLASSIYLTALLYSFLSLQMNLLARYNMPEDTLEAPVQPLPGGPLSANASKAFLDLVLQVVLNQNQVSLAVHRIECVVRASTSDLDLAQTPSMDEVEDLYTTILNRSWSDAQCTDNGEDGGNQTDFINAFGEQNGTSLSAMLHEWLFDEVGGQRGIIGENNSDINYVWLIGEFLDLCEVLNFNNFVLNNTMVVRDFVMRRMRDNVTDGDTCKRSTYARLLARFSSMASTVLSCREQFAGNESSQEGDAIPMVSRDNLDRCIAEDEVGTYFAASVFLSGEKEGATGAVGR